MSYNFLLGPVDTDSISFCKQDLSEFTEEEQDNLLKEINAMCPDMIKYDHDGYFKTVICLKAKNYILDDGSGKIKKKGSSLKSSTLEPALKKFLDEVIQLLLDDADHIKLTTLYHKYVRDIYNIADIKPWCSKKTISERTLKSERKNETKIIDAINGSEYVEGDKVFVYFKDDDSLELAEKFDGVYNKEVFLEKLYKTTGRFDLVIPTKELFLNYSLKRNKAKLEEVLNAY